MVQDKKDKVHKKQCCDKSLRLRYGFVTSSFTLGICEFITLFFMFWRGSIHSLFLCGIFLCLYKITNNYKGSVTLRKVLLGTYLAQVAQGAVYVATDIYCHNLGILTDYHEVLYQMRRKIRMLHIGCLPIRLILILVICHRWKKEKHILMQSPNFPKDDKYEIPNTC